MGYVFDFNDSRGYDAWFEKPRSRHAFDLEIKLLTEMMKPQPRERLLDIGCGTGKSMEALFDSGLHMTGIDPSPYMLDIARKRLGSRVDLHRGYGESLPFEDNAFDISIFFNSLEFTDRPAKAIEEACRVTRDRVFVCVWNTWAPLNLVRRAKSRIFPDIFSHASCFGIWELKRILYAILGEVQASWRTTPQLPGMTGRVASYLETFPGVRRSPLGTMIAMKIKPVPKFRTRPLFLTLKKAQGYKPVSGFARALHREVHESKFLRKTG